MSSFFSHFAKDFAMKRISLVLAGLLVVASSLALAAGLETLEMIPETNWELGMIRSEGVCSALTVYEKSNTAFGFISDGDKWSLIIVNPKWKLPINVIYRIYIHSDLGWSYIDALVQDTDVLSSVLFPKGVRDLSKTSQITLYNSDNTFIGKFSMAGSSKALTASAQCAQALKRSILNSANPFETQQDNPFRGTEKETNL